MLGKHSDLPFIIKHENSVHSTGFISFFCRSYDQSSVFIPLVPQQLADSQHYSLSFCCCTADHTIYTCVFCFLGPGRLIGQDNSLCCVPWWKTRTPSKNKINDLYTSSTVVPFLFVEYIKTKTWLHFCSRRTCASEL